MTVTTTAPSRLLDGRAVSKRLIEQCAVASDALVRAFGIQPHLAVVLVGNDPASAVYVGAKQRACARAGVRSTVVRTSSTVTTDELINEIEKLANDPAVHGLIVQLPLPAHILIENVTALIPPEKDADGFHALNIGSMFLGQEGLPPCTPDGIMRLLDDADIELEGRRVVIVGASNIVGKPIAVLALNRGATVTVCNDKTAVLEEHTKGADVLICAAGRPGLITGDMVKPGAIVVDVGINRLADGSLVGDVDFPTVAQRASLISPVPGGVGPMTVAVLIHNTVLAATKIAERNGRPTD